MRSFRTIAAKSLTRMGQDAIRSLRVQLAHAEQAGNAIEVGTILEKIALYETQLAALESSTGPERGSRGQRLGPSHQRPAAGDERLGVSQELPAAHGASAEEEAFETGSLYADTESTQPF